MVWYRTVELLILCSASLMNVIARVFRDSSFVVVACHAKKINYELRDYH